MVRKDKTGYCAPQSEICKADIAAVICISFLFYVEENPFDENTEEDW